MSGIILDKRFKTEQGTISYGSAGTGEPVVLVHGTPSTSYIWRHVAHRLAERFNVLVYDLVGYGQSQGNPEQDKRLRSHAATLSALCQHCDMRHPHLVGHDFGGATVLGAHLIEGVAAKSLTILDAVSLNPWGTPYAHLVRDNPDVFQELPEYVHLAMVGAHLDTATFHKLAPDAYNVYLQQWAGTDGQAHYVKTFRDFDFAFTERLETLYPSITIPTQCLWGEHDRWVAPDVGTRLADMIPDATFELLPDAGHFSMEDIPGTIATRIAAHVDAAS